MNKNVYIASWQPGAGKSAIALGVIDTLSTLTKRIGIFRPLLNDLEEDIVISTLIKHPCVNQKFDEAVGVDYETWANDPEAGLDAIMAKYVSLARQYDAVVVIGSDNDCSYSTNEVLANATIAANLNCPVLLTIRGQEMTAEQIKTSAEGLKKRFESAHATVAGVFATRIMPEEIANVTQELKQLNIFSTALPYDRVLAAPSVGSQFKVLNANLWRGDRELLEKESLGTFICDTSLATLLCQLKDEYSLILSEDRLDVLPGLLLAQTSTSFAHLGAIFIMSKNIPLSIQKLLDTQTIRIPIGTCSYDTYQAVSLLHGLQGRTLRTARKAAIAREIFSKQVDQKQLLDVIISVQSNIVTPNIFDFQLAEQARSNKKTIVLPESSDDRILCASAIVLKRQVANLILLGDQEKINCRAKELNLDLSDAKIVNPNNQELVEKFAAEYAKLRAHKGVTIEKAREVLKDLSYFGTMMVYFGLADGMVSGSITTTANTIRPSLEFIKTKPGVKVVSGAFLMCMPDRVLVFADCAVNPNPNVEQLADIAISSAETAKRFGIEPRVAMLSYSTGSSGFGEDVDLVRAATEIVRQKNPEILVEGPIQFDAAIDETVANKKMPGSQVAGKATVFIFPDLNTGNNTYKAVQRTSGAIAVGPVLQGLKKPVNDLSRGALVDDIVNTITITAIQAQSE